MWQSKRSSFTSFLFLFIFFLCLFRVLVHVWPPHHLRYRVQCLIEHRWNMTWTRTCPPKLWLLSHKKLYHCFLSEILIWQDPLLFCRKWLEFLSSSVCSYTHRNPEKKFRCFRKIDMTDWSSKRMIWIKNNTAWDSKCSSRLKRCHYDQKIVSLNLDHAACISSWSPEYNSLWVGRWWSISKSSLRSFWSAQGIC